MGSEARAMDDTLPARWDEEMQTRNVGPLERGASLTVGVALLAFGLGERRPALSALLAAAGAYLGWRGVTGRCALYDVLDYSTSDVDDEARLGGGAHVDRSVQGTVTIDRPLEEVYAFWRRLENVPRFSARVKKVDEFDDTRSRWIAEGPGGAPLEWESEVLEDRPGELIAWRSVPGSDVHHEGAVRFRPAPGGRGTEVRVDLEHAPPAGVVGRVAARLIGVAPARELDEDLRRLKQLLEAGEVATTDGQPYGPTTPAGEVVYQAAKAGLEAAR